MKTFSRLVSHLVSHLAAMLTAMLAATSQSLSRILAACLVGGRSAIAAPIILNGGFESGFSSWTRADQLGSDGSFLLQAGTVSPVNGDPVPAPPGGITAAMTDAGAPGSHVLYQDFVVDNSAPVLSFDLFLGNRGGAFVTANPATVGLDFSTACLEPAGARRHPEEHADPFSVAASDVLMNLYQTKPGDPLVSGYNTLGFDLSPLFAANLGQTLRLRFAETDNLGQLQLGVDNVSLEAVPSRPRCCCSELASPRCCAPPPSQVALGPFPKPASRGGLDEDSDAKWVALATAGAAISRCRDQLIPAAPRPIRRR